MSAILVAENITKRYARHTALSQVSLEVPEHSIYGLLGPNGAGKTTLIRIITQILAADEGQVYINGERLEPRHIGVIGYLPEERGLYKKMKVGEQLLYLARLKGLNRQDAVKKINYWLERLEMKNWAGSNVEDLSKGMQQKIQFISTVLHEPKLIILDEPFSGFDPVNANLIKDEILRIRENGATIIFSTHRMESVEELCDYIALINKSEKILDGPKKAIKDNHKSNTYLVTHTGLLDGLDDRFVIIDKQEKDGENFSSIRIKDGLSANALIGELIRQVEVRSFTEKIPTMNEIFIMNVSEGGAL